MKNRKLIAIDVDGTLVDDRCILSSLTRDYLRRLTAEGHLIVLASGRPWRSMQGYYDELGCSGPVISYNGAYVFDPKDRSFPVVKRTFGREKIKDIYVQIGDRATSFMCESEKNIYLKRVDPYLDHYFWYRGMGMHVGPIDKILAEDPFTAIMRSSHRYDGDLKRIVEAHEGLKFRHWTSSFYSEIYLPDASKGHGLAYIIGKLGYEKKDIICFGDSDNDLEMLRLGGLSFAMKGCKSLILKENFPATKKGNGHDGVAFQLREILGD